MSDKVSKTAARPKGRPKIDDTLSLFMAVQLAQGKVSLREGRKVSIRELVGPGRFKFDGWIKELGTGHKPLRDEIGGETLRRRYREAKLKLVPDPLPDFILSSTAYDEVRKLTDDTIDRMVTDLAS